MRRKTKKKKALRGNKTVPCVLFLARLPILDLCGEKVTSGVDLGLETRRSFSSRGFPGKTRRKKKGGANLGPCQALKHSLERLVVGKRHHRGRQRGWCLGESRAVRQPA